MDLEDPHIAIRRKGDFESVSAHCNALKNRKNPPPQKKNKKSENLHFLGEWWASNGHGNAT